MSIATRTLWPETHHSTASIFIKVGRAQWMDMDGWCSGRATLKQRKRWISGGLAGELLSRSMQLSARAGDYRDQDTLMRDS